MNDDLTRRRKMRLAIEGGRETLLVIEHDELARSALRRNLRALGYRVLDARSAAEADDVLRTDAVDLAIGHFAMPGMSVIADRVSVLWLSVDLVDARFTTARLAASIRQALETRLVAKSG